MKIYELINILQECNQEAEVVPSVDLSWDSSGKIRHLGSRQRDGITILPEDTKSRQSAKEIELVI